MMRLIREEGMGLRMVNPPEPQLALPPQADGYRHRFHAMVKPVGSLCNLECTYCYFFASRPHRGNGSMLVGVVHQQL